MFETATSERSNRQAPREAPPETAAAAAATATTCLSSPTDNSTAFDSPEPSQFWSSSPFYSLSLSRAPSPGPPVAECSILSRILVPSALLFFSHSTRSAWSPSWKPLASRLQPDSRSQSRLVLVLSPEVEVGAGARAGAGAGTKSSNDSDNNNNCAELPALKRLGKAYPSGQGGFHRWLHQQQVSPPTPSPGRPARRRSSLRRLKLAPGPEDKPPEPAANGADFEPRAGQRLATGCRRTG